MVPIIGMGRRKHGQKNKETMGRQTAKSNWQTAQSHPGDKAVTVSFSVAGDVFRQSIMLQNIGNFSAKIFNPDYLVKGYNTITNCSTRWSSISVVCVAKTEMRRVPSLGSPGPRGM